MYPQGIHLFLSEYIVTAAAYQVLSAATHFSKEIPVLFIKTKRNLTALQRALKQNCVLHLICVATYLKEKCVLYLINLDTYLTQKCLLYLINVDTYITQKCVLHLNKLDT
jgi:hypothetical protein